MFVYVKANSLWEREILYGGENGEEDVCGRGEWRER